MFCYVFRSKSYLAQTNIENDNNFQQHNKYRLFRLRILHILKANSVHLMHVKRNLVRKTITH